MGQRSWSSSSPSSDQQHDTQSQEAARSSIDNPFSASDTSIPNARQNESSTLTRNELHPPSKPSPTYNSSGSTYASQPVSTLTPHQRFLDRIDDFDPVFSQGPSVSKPGEKSAFQPQKKLEISKGHGNPTISGSANREAVQSSPPSSTKTRTSPSSRCSHQDASRRPSSLAQAHRQHPHSPYGRPGYNRTVGIEEGDEEDKESSVWVLVSRPTICDFCPSLVLLPTSLLVISRFELMVMLGLLIPHVSTALTPNRPLHHISATAIAPISPLLPIPETPPTPTPRASYLQFICSSFTLPASPLSTFFLTCSSTSTTFTATTPNRKHTLRRESDCLRLL